MPAFDPAEYGTVLADLIASTVFFSPLKPSPKSRYWELDHPIPHFFLRKASPCHVPEQLPSKAIP